MVFNSFNFWLIFPFIFVIYWAIPMRYNRVRNIFLLAVSYLLYMNWKPFFAIVLLGVTLITWLGGAILDSSKDPKSSSGSSFDSATSIPLSTSQEPSSSRGKTLCWCFTLLGLLPLLAFKYYNFLNDSLTSVLESFGLHFALPGLNWAIPVGISFFTFQAVGYLLDVYHKRVPAEKNFWDYALFVSFFPQVTSGPISTAKDLMPQFKTPHAFKYDQVKKGLQELLWGMFLKLVLADRLGDFVDTVFGHYDYYTSATCIIASLAYTIQIYCDFAGYSLMAIGIAKTLGFDLINNFERPYFAASVTEFWKRWHISLTRWLTTHVYINLGGNRCSKFRQYLNIMVTFLVSGLWHGASWTFVIWGVLHGLFQIVEKALMGERLKQELKSNSVKLSAVRLMRIVMTFCLVSFAWIFFRMPTIGEAFDVIARMFANAGGRTESIMYSYIVIPSLLAVLGSEFISEYFPNGISMMNSRYVVIRWATYITLIVVMMLYGVLDAGSFIYVSF